MKGSVGTNVEIAAEELRKGRLVAIPTETVYGLAANALDERAVLSIFKAKERPFSDPLIVHVPSLVEASKYILSFPRQLEILARAFWPGPLTLLLPKKECVSGLVTASSNLVAIRVPNHPLTLQLLQSLDFPLAAPSANPFGYVSPTTPEHVQAQLGSFTSYILDGGPCSVGIESTIVGIIDGKVRIFRQGAISEERIRELIGNDLDCLPQAPARRAPVVPGSLKTHYAPSKPLILGNIEELLNRYKGRKIAVLSFCHLYRHPSICCQIQLSPKQSLVEAAKNLFAALRFLDTQGIDIILAEEVEDVGIGRAINDRLKRAAALTDIAASA